MHGLRTPREEIAFTAWPKIQSQSQIFRYGRSIFSLPHLPKFSDIFDLCLHWVSVVRNNNSWKSALPHIFVQEPASIENYFQQIFKPSNQNFVQIPVQKADAKTISEGHWLQFVLWMRSYLNLYSCNAEVVCQSIESMGSFKANSL